MTPEPDAIAEPDDATVPADELTDDVLDGVAGGLTMNKSASQH